MIGRVLFPFALGFLVGGLVVSTIDSRKRNPPPGIWIDEQEMA